MCEKIWLLGRSARFCAFFEKPAEQLILRVFVGPEPLFALIVASLPAVSRDSPSWFSESPPDARVTPRGAAHVLPE
uniref:Uncharacterized protein n=1 Tax=mine drainage metagenome TaxID=410659 RepID=E6QER6_9ZZZZ